MFYVHRILSAVVVNWRVVMNGLYLMSLAMDDTRAKLDTERDFKQSCSSPGLIKVLVRDAEDLLSCWWKKKMI